MNRQLTQLVYHNTKIDLAQMIINSAPMGMKGWRIGKRLSSSAVIINYDTGYGIAGFRSLNKLNQLLDNYGQSVL